MTILSVFVGIGMGEYISNPGFEMDLDGWTCLNGCLVESDNPFEGTKYVKLTPGAQLSQDINLTTIENCTADTLDCSVPLLSKVVISWYFSRLPNQAGILKVSGGIFEPRSWSGDEIGTNWSHAEIGYLTNENVIKLIFECDASLGSINLDSFSVSLEDKSDIIRKINDFCSALGFSCNKEIFPGLKLGYFLIIIACVLIFCCIPCLCCICAIYGMCVCCAWCCPCCKSCQKRGHGTRTNSGEIALVEKQGSSFQ